jgi:hypothetical protein
MIAIAGLDTSLLKWSFRSKQHDEVKLVVRQERKLKVIINKFVGYDIIL